LTETCGQLTPILIDLGLFYDATKPADRNKVCGTRRFMAPELFALSEDVAYNDVKPAEIYPSKSDAYALGITLVWMALKGDLPKASFTPEGLEVVVKDTDLLEFKKEQPAFMTPEDVDRALPPKRFSEAFRTLIKQLTNLNQKLRPVMSDLIMDEGWVRDGPPGAKAAVGST